MDDICDSLGQLLAEEEEGPEQCMRFQDPAPLVALPGGRERPTWAKPGGVNGRGVLRKSPAHYFALVEISGATTEAIVDTGGARTMLDTKICQHLGL